jgi:hypothetical protein
VTGQPVFLGDGLSGYGQLGLKDSVHTGNAPKKFIRANGSTGAFEVISADASRVVLSVDDAGNTSAQGNGTFAQLFAFATNGVRRAIRTSAAGALEFVNSAYTAVIATLGDDGSLSLSGPLSAPSVAADLTGNFTSSDGTVAVTDAGGAPTLPFLNDIVHTAEAA